MLASSLRWSTARLRTFSVSALLRTPNRSPKPPPLIDDSTSALDYKSTQRTRPPPLPVSDVPRSRSAEEAVTNILYNTPPPNLEPYKKYVFRVHVNHGSNERRRPGTFSTVSFKTNLEFYHAYPASWLDGVSTSTPWSSVAPKFAT